MPFVVEQSPTFRAPVRFGVPGADGTPVHYEFTAVFKRLDDDEAKALSKEAADTGMNDVQVAARILVGWGQDVTDAHGLPLPFTPENLAAVLRVQNCAAGVLRAHKKALQDADLGN